MTQKNIKTKRGFTIIEVVLVLAIAGLIFLMVFVALPALQRSQRDTQRRQDYADLSANVTNYTTNNNGSLPVPNKTKLPANKYVNKDGLDPNGKTYTVNVIAASDGTYVGDNASLPAEATIYVVIGADCSGTNKDGNKAPGSNGSSKAFAVYGYLETGSYCQSSI